MIHILVLEDDAKLNQVVCTYLNDSGFAAKGCLDANSATTSSTTACTTSSFRIS